MKKFIKKLIPIKIYIQLAIIRQNILYTISVWKKFLSGSKIYNKFIYPNLFKNIDIFWKIYPLSSMQKELENILIESNIKNRFNSVIEFGCGTSHFTPILKKNANKIYGVDIIEKEKVSPLFDHYIRCPDEIKTSYLDEIKSESIDCIYILHVSGYGYSKTKNNFTSFENIFNDKTHRTGRYFQDFNRILKNNGHIVLVEFEIHSHLNFTKHDNLKKIRNNFNKYYPLPKLKNYEIVTNGIKEDMSGPYVVLKKI